MPLAQKLVEGISIEEIGDVDQHDAQMLREPSKRRRPLEPRQVDHKRDDDLQVRDQQLGGLRKGRERRSDLSEGVRVEGRREASRLEHEPLLDHQPRRVRGAAEDLRLAP